MVRAKAKKRTKRKTGKKSRISLPQIQLSTIFYTLFLFSLLIFSLGLLGYFIFFRTVVAAELPAVQGKDIVFEEPMESFIVPQGKIVEDITSPKCAIIIDDMGFHHKVGKGLLNLPLDLTFSFLPHAPHTKELEDMAYQLGRTILLHLPLEPEDDKWDPGPGALFLNNLSNQSELFLSNLEMVPHAMGVNNHMGSLYTANEEAMTSLLKLIDKKRLFFVDSYTASDSVGLKVARSQGVPVARRNVFLDNVLTVETICDQIEQLVSIAQRRGSAIGIAHPNAETLQALKKCGDLLQSSVTVVGVEELLQ